jgi:branched-subunit amino acid ABC-type transport system permease component
MRTAPEPPCGLSAGTALPLNGKERAAGGPDPIGKRGAMVAAIAALAALCSCAAVTDAGRARTCRSILPALNAQAAIRIERTTDLGGGDGVRIDYLARAAMGRPERRFLECRFAAGSQAARERERLLGVRTESGPLGDLRLHILKRFWLEREGAAADPEPVQNAQQAPEVPRKMAIGLQHLLFALPPIAIYGLLAAAYSLIYGLVGRINLAFGELAAVGGYGAFLAFALIGPLGSAGAGLALALMLALLSALSCGIATGRLVLTPLMRLSGQQALIGTMALAIVLQEFLRLTQGSRLLWVEPMFNAPYAVARAGDFLVTITPIALAAALLCLLAALALLALMKFSRFGRAWRACADDPLAAALFGIDHGLILFKTFVLASALAGLAGYVMTIYYGTVGYAGGIVLGLKSLVAAVAGGIGSVPGALLGGILLGGTESLWSALFPIEFRDLIIFVALVLLVVLRPAGLFGINEALPPKI